MEKYYQILGLSIGASKASVRSAYRRLAKIYHPDVNNSPGANDKFLQITEAYDALYYGKFPRRRSFASQQTNRDHKPYRPQETPEQRRQRFAKARAERAKAKAKKEQEEFEKTYLYDIIQIIIYLAKVFFLLIPILFFGNVLFNLVFEDSIKGYVYFEIIIASLFTFVIYSYKETYFKLKLNNISPNEFKNLFKKRINKSESCFFTNTFVADGPAYLFRLYKALEIKTRRSTPLNHKVLTKTKVRRVHVARSLFAFKIHLIMKAVRIFSVILSLIFIPLDSLVWCFSFGVFISILINQFISFFTKVKTDFYFFTNYYTLIRIGIIFLVLLLDTNFVNSPFMTSDNLWIWLILLFIMTDFIVTPLVVEIKGNKLLRPLGSKTYNKIDQLLDEGYQIGYMESFPSALYSVFKWFF